MADGPKDYRDPKVTSTGSSGAKSSMNWLWWVLGAIVLLLILAWLLGWFGTGTTTTTTTPATTTEPPAATAPATDGEIVVDPN